MCWIEGFYPDNADGLLKVGAQYGGEVVNYEEGLAFVTFHGSGHMVPQFR
jgi:Serine carboxypeptidase